MSGRRFHCLHEEDISEDHDHKQDFLDKTLVMVIVLVLLMSINSEDHDHMCSKSLGGDLGHGHRLFLLP